MRLNTHEIRVFATKNFRSKSEKHVKFQVWRPKASDLSREMICLPFCIFMPAIFQPEGPGQHPQLTIRIIEKTNLIKMANKCCGWKTREKQTVRSQTKTPTCHIWQVFAGHNSKNQLFLSDYWSEWMIVPNSEIDVFMGNKFLKFKNLTGKVKRKNIWREIKICLQFQIRQI